MKNKMVLPLVALLLIGCSQLFSQVKTAKVKVLWGEPSKGGSQVTDAETFGYDSTGFYILKQVYGGNTVSHIDYKMNVIAESPIPMQTAKRNGIYEFVDLLDNTVYVFYTEKDKKTDETVLYRESLDPATMKMKDDKTEVHRNDYERKYGVKLYDRIFSKNKKYFLVVCIIPKAYTGLLRYKLMMYDNKLNLLWKSDIKFPYDHELFDVERIKVDDNGNAYMSGRLYAEEKDRYAKKYTHKLFGFYDNGTTQREYSPDFGDKRATDMQFTVNADGTIATGGFYTDKARGNNSMKGCYYANLDSKTGAVLSSGTKQFDEKFMTQYMNEYTIDKARSNGGIEMKNYDLEEIVRRHDGSTLMIAEQRRSSSYLGGTDPSFVTFAGSSFYYNDILVMNIAVDGKIDWVKKIHKEQDLNMSNKKVGSHATAVIDDKVYFIYNDYKDNLTLPDGDKFKLFSKVNNNTAVVLASVDEKGTIKKELLFDQEDIEFNTLPLACSQTDDKTVVVYTKRGAKQQFARITFE